MNDAPKLVEGDREDSVLVLQIRASRLSDPTLSYALRDQVLQLADAAGVTDFVIDFKLVEAMGSVGLVALLGLRRHVANARIVLVNLNESIYTVLVTSQLVPGYGDTAKIFDVAENVAEATAKLRA